jgi:segregation and condensation protein B
MATDAILPPLAEPKPEAAAAAAPAQAIDEAAAPLLAAAEALIVSSPRPVPAVRLAQALGLMPPDEPAPEEPAGTVAAAPGMSEAGEAAVSTPAPKRRSRRRAQSGPAPEAVLARIVSLLNEVYASSGRSFRIEAVAGGFRVMTLPEHGSVIAALQGLSAHAKLSRAAIETLAIIAYRQPVTRAHLEAIRGVSCGEVVKTLLDRKLITIAGRAEELGRPLLYGTTRQFLAAFGLASIKDLPAPSELGLRAV